jgi:hypothetical protein
MWICGSILYDLPENDKHRQRVNDLEIRWELELYGGEQSCSSTVGITVHCNDHLQGSPVPTFLARIQTCSIQKLTDK